MKIFLTALAWASLLPLGFAGAVEAPVATPPGGTYLDSVTVSISSATPGATIFYTLDGSTPSLTNGFLYAFPLEIGDDTELKIVAIAGGAASGVTTETYTIVPLPAPTLRVIGKKSIKTKKSVVTIRGTSANAEEVDYKIGQNGDYKVAKGVPDWRIKARLKPGRNTFFIYAIGPDEDSDPARVVVILLK